ncbi:MAG: LysE family translocator [Pseudomonadota bacterium]
MPPIEVLITFVIAALLMNISPGPSNLYVMARSIAQGISGGVAASAGLAAGGLIHVCATVLGLSALFKYSPTLYLVVKLLGAGYLIYLGVQYFLTKNATKTDLAQQPVASQKPMKKIFYESVIVEVTNPKTALFFLALLPQFVVPESGAVSIQLFVLGIIVVATAIPCDLLVAFFSTKMSQWISDNPKAQLIQNKISGSILAGMGIYIAGDEVLVLADK